MDIQDLDDFEVREGLIYAPGAWKAQLFTEEERGVSVMARLVEPRTGGIARPSTHSVSTDGLRIGSHTLVEGGDWAILHGLLSDDSVVTLMAFRLSD